MISGTKVITHFHLKTNEIDYNTLTEHAIVSYDTLKTIKRVPLNNEAWAG